MDSPGLAASTGGLRRVKRGLSQIFRPAGATLSRGCHACPARPGTFASSYLIFKALLELQWALNIIIISQFILHAVLQWNCVNALYILIVHFKSTQKCIYSDDSIQNRSLNIALSDTTSHCAVRFIAFIPSRGDLAWRDKCNKSYCTMWGCIAKGDI